MKNIPKKNSPAGFSVRKTLPSELNAVWETILTAREFMKKTGNPNQWGDHHPTKEQIEEDIAIGNAYVVFYQGEIVGTFAFVFGEDPTYSFIEGRWLNDEPYATIHRIASNGRVPGVFSAALAFAETKTKNLRIDTHEDNKVMQHLLLKNHFTYCGTVYIRDHETRRAYMKIF